MIADKLFKDGYDILRPSKLVMAKDRFPNINQYTLYNYRVQPNSFIHATDKQVGIKMLKLCNEHGTCSYMQMLKALFPDKKYGHDKTLWDSLRTRKLIELSHKGKYREEFYKLTDLGKEVLEIVKINYKYYRIARWFNIDEDKLYVEMLNADLKGEEAYCDLDPATFIELLEVLFNIDSDMHKVGSCYRWMNNIIKAIKTDSSFCKKISDSVVIDWIGSHKYLHGVEKVDKILAKAQKKHLKTVN